MTANRWSKRFYESTRGRIVALLRRASMTVDQLAATLGVTDNAVRAQLATLERDGLIEQRVLKRGSVGKPATSYRIARDAEPLFSGAYLPILRGLLEVLSERLRPDELDRILRSVGARLAARQRVAGVSHRERVQSAAHLLDELGGISEVENPGDGLLTIRGFSCPLGAMVQEHPELCNAVESMLTEIIGSPVRERCQRGSHVDRACCCFEVLSERTLPDASGHP